MKDRLIILDDDPEFTSFTGTIAEASGYEVLEVTDPLHDREMVLIVEDDPLVREYAVRCVESLCYRSVAAESGDEALRIIAKGQPIDVLFTDIVMPGGFSGWDLAERAATIIPGLRVLFSSGYALETLNARRQLPDGAMFLGKPYRKVELERRLIETISGGPYGSGKQE